MKRARWSATVLTAVALLTAVAHAPEGLKAQSAAALRDDCAAMGGGMDRCTDVAIAARALTGVSGLLASAGPDVPGSSSTLGTKIGSRPRFSTSFRAGAAWVGLPDIFDEGMGTASGVSFLVPALQFGIAAGVLDGFSPMATVGGVLSVDLFGSMGLVMPPSSQGFAGNSTRASVGARVGLLRESFTLPGVSVSVAHSFHGVTGMGDTALGDPAHVEVRPSTSSVRATIGKDLFGVGVLAGVGLDRASSDVVVEVQSFGTAPVRVAAPLDTTRRIYFGGAALNFLLLQLALEGGWAAGHASLPGGAGSSFDPTGGTLFGNLALRFTP